MLVEKVVRECRSTSAGGFILGEYDNTGNVVASGDSTADAFVNWAADLYRPYREHADPIRASEYLYRRKGEHPQLRGHVRYVSGRLC